MNNNDRRLFPGSIKTNSRGVVDLTSGSIPLNLLKLAWPMIVSSSLNMLGPTIDFIWVGKLGSAAVAGVGVAGMAVQFLMSAMMGLAIGMRAMIARYIGAKDIANANRVATQAILVSLFLSIITSLIGIFLSEPILLLLGLEADVVQEGAAYLRVIFASSVLMNVRFVGEGSMQATGDTITPMKITFLFRLLHIVICPFFIFGWWIFPQLGVVGAALTNGIAQGVGLIITFWVLFTGRTRLRLNLRDLHIDLPLIWRVVKIGIPSSVMAAQQSLGAFVLVKFLSPFGTNAVAAHSIWQRVDMILIMPIWGLGMAAGVLCGQNLGAKRPERAVKTGWIATFMAEGLTLIYALVLFFLARNVVYIFNSEPELLSLGTEFLRIASIGYLFFGFTIVLQNCISGAGDTLPPMLLSILASWGIQIPLAYFLPRVPGLGVYGVRWAMVIALFVGAIAFAVYFLGGRWKRKKV
ncbi:MAG: MATE family efflux transporter [Dehalococcoidales bacterium]|nr:MATE family efflux transporter [Dehalococcoidales bacterium]